MDAPAFIDARRWTLLTVIVLAVAVRLLAAKALPGNLSRDDDSYRFIAGQVANHGRFARELTGREPAVTAYRPPLYPLLLAGIEIFDPQSKNGPRDWAVLALNVCLGGVTAALVALTAMKLVQSEEGTQWRAGLIAGVLVAIDPLLVYNATLAMTETLAAALAAGVLWAILAWLQRPSTYLAVAIGLILGLATLARPIFAPWLALVVLLTWLRAPETIGRKVANFHALVITLTAAMVIAPWVVRNFAVMGKPIASTTHGGYTLLLGNNPHFYTHLHKEGWGAPWDDTDFQRAWRHRFDAKSIEQFSWNAPDDLAAPPPRVPDPFDELADDQLAKSLAYRAIQAEPMRFVEACLYRAWQLWKPIPSRTEKEESFKRTAFRYGVGIWNLGVYFLAFCPIRIPRQYSDAARVWLLYVLALALVLTLVHTFYWSNVRMRVPIVPAICVLAGLGLSDTLWPAYVPQQRNKKS